MFVNTKLVSLVLIAAVGVNAQSSSSSSSSALTGLPSNLPTCVTNCFLQAAGTAGCSSMYVNLLLRHRDTCSLNRRLQHGLDMLLH